MRSVAGRRSARRRGGLALTTVTLPDHDRTPRRSGARDTLREGIPAVSLEELLAALSQALDLAEGRDKGHALRVSYIAYATARAMGLSRAHGRTALLAGLLHDIGVPLASEAAGELGHGFEHTLFAGVPLRTPATILGVDDPRALGRAVEALHEHTFAGATAVAALGLPAGVAEAVLCHHEHYDGSGFPLRLFGAAIPPLGRIVAAADLTDSLLGADANPLLARRRVEAALREQSGRALHPQVVNALAGVVRRDDFWLGLYSGRLQDLVTDLAHGAPLGSAEILRAVEAFAGIVETRSGHKRGHARRVAAVARRLAAALGLSDGHVQMVELAGLLHDLGMVRVPCHIIGKPEILTVDEMLLLHEHPLETAAIVATIPGWSAIAAWTAAHHERLDGRGYPQGLAGEEIPIEARIITAADIYAALTADRPQRGALTAAAALAAMREMAGTILDPVLPAALAGLDGMEPPPEAEARGG
jgi:putative nucleotidyltransferase with HDIG domain